MSLSDLDEQKKQAWITALRLLTATPKSVKELGDKLTAKGFSENIILETLSKLQTNGILSDRAFANNIVSRLTEGRPSGSRKISFELKRKGIPAQVREEVLEGLNQDDEKARALDLARSKWDKFIHLAPDKRKRRVYDFLMRRGFDYQNVREIVEALEREK